MFKKISFFNILLILTVISLAYADYCDLNCKECASETVCKVCEEDLHRVLKEGKCVCESGHKENARFVCESTDKTINIILLIFCIIFIIGFIYYVFNIDKINPLSFCTMLIFKHHPVDPSQKKLMPVNQDTNLNFTTTLPLQTDGGAAFQNNLKSKTKEQSEDLERQSKAVQDMEDIIGQKKKKDNINSVNDIESKQSDQIDQVVGLDSEKKQQQFSIDDDDDDDNNKNEESKADDKLDSDDISDFGNDDDLDKQQDQQDKDYSSRKSSKVSQSQEQNSYSGSSSNNNNKNDIIQNGSNVIQDDDNFEF